MPQHVPYSLHAPFPPVVQHPRRLCHNRAESFSSRTAISTTPRPAAPNSSWTAWPTA